MNDFVERLRAGEDGLEYAAADEIEELEKKLSAYKHVLRNFNFEKNGFPFICGTLGKEYHDGLHEGYWICVAFGSDNTLPYMVKKKNDDDD